MTEPVGSAYHERLPRTLGPWSAAFILIGITIGSGIFRVPAQIADSLGTPGAFLLVWVIGGLITLTGALAIAELAAMYPRSGGILAYIEEAWGPIPAFVYGWAELTVIRASSVGAISTIFAEYLGHFVALSESEVRFVAAATIIAIALLNWVGIGYASVLMNVTTILKYGALGGLTLFAFGAGDGNLANLSLRADPAAVVGASAILTALIAVTWTYDGWSNLAQVGGEVKDPGRNLPRALILGSASIVAIYLCINAAYLYLVPLTEMAEMPLVAAEAARRIPLFGAAGMSIISAVVMLSCFGATNGSMMTGPRVFFGMADRGLFFPVLARVSPRFQTPSVSIWVAAGLGVTYVLQNSFAELAGRYILGVWPFYVLAVLAVYVLRKRLPDAHRPYRTWGYPVTPAIFLLASVAMIANAVITDPENTLFTFAIIGAGIPVYFIWRAWQKRGIERAVRETSSRLE
ncbi:MAG TPA: amino acid permease [Woeseiaceae bacterium]|nr:amino acid permease [Woeseiaceae bacterium]